MVHPQLAFTPQGSASGSNIPATVYKNSHSHIIYTDGTTYYAINGDTGSLSSNSSFSSLMINIMSTYGTGGGRIFIKKGLYMVDVTNPSGGLGPVGIALPVAAPYIEIEGEGWGTILRASDPNQLMLRDDNDGSTSSYNYTRIANLQIDGNKANTNMIANRSCVVFFKRSDVVYDNILCINGPYQGLSYAGEGRYATSPGASRCRTINCYVRDCNNNGYDIGSNYFQMQNCVSQNNSIGVGSGNNAGLDFDSAQWCTVDGYISIGDYFGFITGTAGIRNTNQCTLNNIYVINPVHYGIYNFGAKNVQINNLYVENSGNEAIRISDGAQDTILNNVIINGTVAGNGVNIIKGSSNIASIRTTINNIRIYNVVNSGNASAIMIDTGSDHTRINNAIVDTFEQVGIFINNAVGAQLNNCYINNGTTLDGVRITGGGDYAKLNNCHVTGARNGFIILAQANNVELSNCSAYLNKRNGFATFGGLRTSFNNCHSWDNSTSSAGSFDGFNIDGDAGANGSSTQCRIVNCFAYDSRAGGSKTQRHGVAITSFGTNTVVILCDIRNNSNAAGISDSGVTSIINNNVGDYITEKAGTATASGDGSTTTFNIAHGLSKTPTFYPVQPGSQDAIGPYWVTAGSTNIVVNFASAPRNGSSNLTFNWRASV